MEGSELMLEVGHLKKGHCFCIVVGDSSSRIREALEQREGSRAEQKVVSVKYP